MAKMKQTKKLRFVTWLLAFVMLIASSAFLLTACSGGDDDDDDSDSTTTRTDTQTFANGDFEYFDDNDGSYRIATAESWTSSADSNASGVSASSSVARSGIVDTSFNWSELWDDYQEFVEYDEMEDEDIPEDAEYYTDMDDEYDVPGWDIAKAAVENEDDDPADEAVKEASEALNPGTHWSGADNVTELDEENGTHVIMLHNYRTSNMGTAARYTSQTITLAAGTAAKVSVWVKTANLTFNDGNAVDGNRGAFIRITNTVGGSEQDPLIVRNIDTKDVTDNNGWQQYTFFVRASEYASTTFSVVLGLGMQTEGNSTSYYEYVQGYAFFDDLEYEVMTSAEYDTQTANVGNKYSLDLSYGSDWMKVDASNGDTYALDLNGAALTGLNVGSDVTVSAPADTVDSRGNTVESYLSDGSTLTANKDSDIRRSGMKSASYLTEANDYTQAFLDGFAKFLGTEESTYPLPFAGGDVLVLYSSLGAPYTAKMEAADGKDIFTLDAGEYMFFSFWMKTSDLQGGTGATVTLIEGENETVIGAIDTSTLATTDLVDDSKKIDSDNYADIFDGWQRCYFFVSNTTETDDLSFSLEFSFGPTTISGTTLSSYAPGYAAFTGFGYSKVSEEDFSVKTTGTYAVEVSLTGGEDEVTSAFDEPGYMDQDKIETDLADLRSYTGAFGGSTYVGGQMLENSEADTANGIDRNGINQVKTAGLLNRDHIDNYTDDLAWVKVIAPTATVLTDELWTEIFGSACTQPLLIANTVEQAYGFFSESGSTIASSAYTVVAVRVILSPKATANVYLIDTAAADFGEKNYTDPLYYGTGVSYRYDEDGNVVNMDPEDTAFSPRANILFYLQDNGLWSTTRQHEDGAYYANLANYEQDDDKNYIDSDGEIVYYFHNDSYFRNYDEDADEYSVEVKDFTAAGVDLEGAVLQQASEEQALSQTVTNDTNSVKTVYVRFFIATGNENKNYRLEVWSGSRDGETTNAANTFVAFDIVNYGSLDATTFGSIVDEKTEDYALAAGYADADAMIEAYEEDPSSFMAGSDGRKLILYRYSLYDDNDYVPFDKDNADEDVTDPYADYDGSTYENEITYMLFNNDNAETTGRIYYDTVVNFGVSEKSVASAGTSSDSDEDEDESGSTYNVALLASSIVLAVVLILTLLALLVRTLVANLRSKKPAAVKPTYDNKRKRYIRKLRLEEAERDENSDDVLPEEDEISEEDIYKVEEEPAEEKAEEASPAEAQEDAAPESTEASDDSFEENK